MTAGALRHRVTLQSVSSAADGDGGIVPTWSDVEPKRQPANVTPASARALERVIAASVQVRASHVVTIRYQSGVTTKMRLLYHDSVGDRVLSIAGVQDPDERHIWLVLACQEEAA